MRVRKKNLGLFYKLFLKKKFTDLLWPWPPQAHNTRKNKINAGLKIICHPEVFHTV
jgi:hypothetical protein